MSDVAEIKVASVAIGPQGETWHDDKVKLSMLSTEGIEVHFYLDIVAASMLALTIGPCISALKSRAGDDLRDYGQGLG